MRKLQKGQVNQHPKVSPVFSNPGAVHDLGRGCFFISLLDGKEAGAGGAEPKSSGSKEAWESATAGLFQEGESSPGRRLHWLKCLHTKRLWVLSLVTLQERSLVLVLSLSLSLSNR